jgi:nucleoside-diphosphate kinase
MILGPEMVQVLAGENAALGNSEIMGGNSSRWGCSWHITWKYAASIDVNAVHGSDAVESAAFEIAYCFSADKVCTH